MAIAIADIKASDNKKVPVRVDDIQEEGVDGPEKIKTGRKLI